MTKHVYTFVCDEAAATAIEYALMAGFIALAVITGVTGIGVKLSSYFSQASSALK